jgi:3-amino-4-hydroxybenzoic acid synthase
VTTELQTLAREATGARVAWIDVRQAGESRRSLVEAALHHRLDGVLDDHPETLDWLPPTVARVAVATDAAQAARLAEHAQIVLVPPSLLPSLAMLAGVEIGVWLEVFDSATVQLACEAARSERWTLLRFRDPTKIPLEIVLAASDQAQAHTVTAVDDLEEARIVLGVLEKGPLGVALAPSSPDDVIRLGELRLQWTPEVQLEELEVRGLRNLGLGDRACVDTCSVFGKDEGMLVGSYARGLVLMCSETHPLPYMPTRPFRVNAGAVHSYALTAPDHTNYLSELESGGQVLAVDTQGRTRPLVVGRVKIERRPLIGIDLASAGGVPVGIILQNDWHVRALAPDGQPRNVTELRPGDRLLGHLLKAQRHVGIAVTEFCNEQ